MCIRFHKLDSTIALQDIVSCAWQSFLVTLSHNNRSKFLTALLQLDGLSSHSAMLSALATLVPSAFGPLKYVHFGLSVLELGSFMYNFDTRRMNFVEACSYRLDSFSRGMWCFLRIPPPPQWCTIFVDALHSSCLHVECIIFFPCTLSMEHSTHVCCARFRVHVCQGFFAVSYLSLHFPALPPYTIKMVKTFSPFSTQFFSSLWWHQPLVSCILAATFHLTPFLVHPVS